MKEKNGLLYEDKNKQLSDECQKCLRIKKDLCNGKTGITPCIAFKDSNRSMKVGN